MNRDGWPYIQHRGGPAGFLKVISPLEIGFADFKGNRQLLTTGHVSGNDRVCLFLLDHALQARLKILGHAEVLSLNQDPALAQILVPEGMRDKVERLFRIRVEGFDWNCPQYITPRFTEAQVEAAIRPMQDRIAELEAAMARA